MQFQDGSRGGAVLLPVSYLMSLHSFEVRNLSTNQISSTHLNLRLRYNYLQFGKKQRSARLEFFFHSRFFPDSSNLRAILNQIPKFRPNRAARVGVITSYTMARWRQRWLNATSGFVFDNVTLIRM